MPKVSVVTAHGRQTLGGHDDERVIDLLGRHGVPWSAVSIYAVPRAGGAPQLCPCLDARLKDLDDFAEVLLYFNRNVNPFIFSIGNFKTVASLDGAPEATEYMYQRFDNAHSKVETFLKKLNPDECREIVAQRVAATVLEVMPADSDLVVGVSGGGDSNALLHGLGQLRDHGLRVLPIIIKGIPDWDSGVPRAQALCRDYGLELTVLEEGDVKELIGLPRASESLIDRFQREFPGDDFEFVGTLLIRLALSRHARALGTRFICTGLNLEDVLCEGIFRIASGMKPAPIPARTIGDITLVMPLWLCPKRIIDGCFPRFSLENYDARYPCVSLGRNLYYSVIYAMQSTFPGLPEQLARSFSMMAASDPTTYVFDEQLGFHVERFVPLALRQKFHRMVGAGPLPTS